MRGRRGGKLGIGLIVGLLAVSACGSEAAISTGQEGDFRVEVVTWWSGQGEEDGLEALVDDFKRRHPEIEFVNASVGGGAGANARAVLTTRLQADDPPDSFQAHGGVELAGDVKSGELENLAALFEREGWSQKLPKAVLDSVTVDGGQYAVPLSVHRSNLLWYNPKVLSAVGVNPPRTWEDFLVQTSVFKSRGITPLALGPEWTHKQLLENVLLGELGADAYNGLWTGRTDWNGVEVTKALTTYVRVISNSDIKAAAGDWQPTLDKVVDGSAAYVVTGDWADAYLRQDRKLTYRTDYQAVAAPGTTGVYNYLVDSFALPKGAPHRGAAEKWLAQVGSAAGQEIFNTRKGSVPARTDTDAAKYTGYLASAIADWRNPNTVLVGSVTYGTSVSAAWNAEIDLALAAFVDDADPFAFADTMTKAYQATR